MSKGDRNGNITRGLILGFLIGGFFFTYLAQLPVSVDVATQTISECSTSPNDCSNNSEQMPDRWYWFRRAFAIEDTIAQWVMMAFTIAAAGLLLFTLQATQRMANDAERFGRSQTRAFVAIKISRVVIEAGRPFSAIVTAYNCGATPAVGLRILGAVQIDKAIAIKNSKIGKIVNEKSGVGSFIEPGGSCHITIDTEKNEMLSAQDVADIRGGAKIIRGLVYTPYRDIFDNKCWTRRDFEISGDYAVSTGNVMDISHGPNSDCG